MEKNLILTGQQVSQKIKRMAFEVYELTSRKRRLCLPASNGQGYMLAHCWPNNFDRDINHQGKVVKVSIDKSAPLQSQIELDAEPSSFKKKCIVVVDDVLNTGKTLAYAMKPFSWC